MVIIIADCSPVKTWSFRNGRMVADSSVVGTEEVKAVEEYSDLSRPEETLDKKK